MPIPVLTAFIIIFILWLQYEIRKASKKSKQSTEGFWQNERKSNLTRRVDITSLDYLIIPLDRLPMADYEDQTINSYRDLILTLSTKKIVNLTGYTNTELKYKYGAANINYLAEYDNNYTILVSMLHKWAERLYDHGYENDTVLVLEYAVSIYTDVTKSFKLLASLYKKQNSSEKIDELIKLVPNTKTLDKDNLIEELTSIKNT